MPDRTRVVAPGPSERLVKAPDGALLEVPAAWVLVPPGDPGLTRRLKAAGPTWTVQEKRGRKLFSRGLWTDPERVKQITADLATERADPAYARKLAAAGARRDREQGAYVEEFRTAVKEWLSFPPRWEELADRLAAAVTELAAPVGSGTVARTRRIPVEKRAEAAVIAWLRHQTTAYDNLRIARVKGKRREVRRDLAGQSRALLASYRKGADRPEDCPLQAALARSIACEPETESEFEEG